MRKNTVLLFSFIAFALSAYSQSDSLIISEDEVSEKWSGFKLSDDELGPNEQKKYDTFNIGLNYIQTLGQSDSLQISPDDFSYSISLSSRTKYRINDHLGWGIAISYTRDNYLLRNDSSQLLFAGNQINTQRFQFSKFGLEGFFRVIFNKPNNKPGFYVDLGGQVNWITGRRMLLEQKVDPKVAAGAKQIDTYVRRLQYVNPWDAQLTARIGLNYLSLVARYRLTDAFRANEGINNNRELPDLPRFSFGIEINLGQ